MHEALLRERNLEDTHIVHVDRIRPNPRTCRNVVFTETDVGACFVKCSITRVNLVLGGTRMLIHSADDAEKSQDHRRRVSLQHPHGLALESLGRADELI